VGAEGDSEPLTGLEAGAALERAGWEPLTCSVKIKMTLAAGTGRAALYAWHSITPAMLLPDLLLPPPPPPQAQPEEEAPEGEKRWKWLSLLSAAAPAAGLELREVGSPPGAVAQLERLQAALAARACAVEESPEAASWQVRLPTSPAWPLLLALRLDAPRPVCHLYLLALPSPPPPPAPAAEPELPDDGAPLRPPVPRPASQDQTPVTADGAALPGQPLVPAEESGRGLQLVVERNLVAADPLEGTVELRRLYGRLGVEGGPPGEECVVCLGEEREAVLLPCRHLAVCAHCLLKLEKCPVCRTSIRAYLLFSG
jgi:hypothetical protein